MKRRILFIGAHPDDLEISCYGFIKQMVQSGSQVYIYVGSNGTASDPTSNLNRISEARSALNFIDSENAEYRNIPGIKISDYENMENRIRQIILKNDIDTLVTHSILDTHQEHRLLSEISITASRRMDLNVIYFQSVSTTVDFIPNLFIDISREYFEKCDAIKKHLSQQDKSYLQDDFLKLFHTKVVNSKIMQKHEFYRMERIFLKQMA